MNIFIAGQKAFGGEAFKLVRELGHTVVGVCAPRFNTAGDMPDRLADQARIYEVPLIEAGGLNAHTLPDNVDLLIAAHSHDFIGAKTRNRCRLGCIGYHPSLLPRHRGRDAIRWTIRMAEPVTGGTVYWLDDRMDAGPIAAQEWCWVRPGDTAEELWRRELFPMGLRLLKQVLQQIASGKINRISQDEAVATFEPALNPPPARRPDLLQLPGPGVAQDELFITTADELSENAYGGVVRR